MVMTWVEVGGFALTDSACSVTLGVLRVTNSVVWVCLARVAAYEIIVLTLSLKNRALRRWRRPSIKIAAQKVRIQPKKYVGPSLESKPGMTKVISSVAQNHIGIGGITLLRGSC